MTGHHHCSLTLPFPNKTWFASHSWCLLCLFSIAVVFITHDISFPAPPAKTHSSHTPVTCMHALTRALSWRQETPCLPTRKVGPKKAQFALQCDSTPYAGLPSAISHWRNGCEERPKKKKKGTNPVSLPSPPQPEPHPPPH